MPTVHPQALPCPDELRIGFVNAQYRFVMNPSGDYTVHFADPDMYAQAACPA